MYEKYLSTIDKYTPEIYALSDALWENPETAFGEYESSGLLADNLKKFGFEVKLGVAGIDTAFTATYGSGKPHFGILAEYDALPGMSQEANVTEPKSIPGEDRGHGCGHNLFAAGSFAAALAVKSYIEETGKGSVTLFGCPAEEGGGGKLYMVRAGLFHDIDAVVSWHPEAMYMVRTRPALANVKVKYHFTGIAAHAGANPDKGRSALDALELMNVGVNFLREHMPLTSRVHYAILDAGGAAPNQVQSHTQVFYMIRAVDLEGVRDLYERVNRIAKGAAMMTDTQVEIELVSGYSNLITIPTLQATADKAMRDIEFPVATEEELKFGKALRETMMLSPQEKSRPVYATEVKQPAPPAAHGGSTDTADVSWHCPTVQMHIGNWVIGTPGHSWQAVAQGKSSYAKKSMIFAGKSVAGTIMRLMDDPALVEQAWKEHAEKTVSGYVCQLPENAVPPMQPRPNK